MSSRFGMQITLPGLGSIILKPANNCGLPPVQKDAEGKLVTLQDSMLRQTLAVPPPTPTGLNGSTPRSRKNSPDAISMKPNYPVISVTKEEFVHEMNKAEESGDFNQIKAFYLTTFHSYAALCATFKAVPDQDGVSPHHQHNLRSDFLHTVYDSLSKLPTTIHKTTLRSIVHALLEESRKLYTKDEVRAMFILLQCPLFNLQTAYAVYAHLLRQVLALSNSDHQLLVHWLRKMEVDRFRAIIQQLLQFITLRQFPSTCEKNLPAPSKSKWWIPTGVRILALLNAANNSSQPPLVHYTEFHNSALDHINLMQEYINWQTPEKPGQFSFCQYPFILSIVAKRYILTKDSEQQMILTARKSLVDKLASNQAYRMDLFFLNISVRRSHLVSDSLKEIASKQRDLKKKLKVSFIGEPGLDMGGLTKEWFQLLIREIFQPDYGMFVYYPNSRNYWFSTSQEGNLREYNLIGVLMGLAVYNSIILDLHFPSVCYRKLLSPPVVPPSSQVPVGVVKHCSLEDLADFMPDVASGLKELLAYEGDVEDDMSLFFQVSLTEYGTVKTVDLKENGGSIPVTATNRSEYVKLYLDWVLNKAIYEKFRAFYLGFHSVCASNALIMLRPEEVEILVCGSPNLDLRILQKNTEYDGYKATDPIIKDFWEVVTTLSPELQKRFLLFATGSDRVPVGGMAEMSLKISKLKDRPEYLPEAHTCFNQLVLPEYPDKETLHQKLIIALSNAEGFGME